MNIGADLELRVSLERLAEVIGERIVLERVLVLDVNEVLSRMKELLIVVKKVVHVEHALPRALDGCSDVTMKGGAELETRLLELAVRLKQRKTFIF